MTWIEGQGEPYSLRAIVDLWRLRGNTYDDYAKQTMANNIEVVRNFARLRIHSATLT